MTWPALTGSDLARSTVVGVGADCPTADARARAMSGRYGTPIDVYGFADWPAGASQRVTKAFVARAWLSRSDRGWLVGHFQTPSVARRI
jgi:hypothetical protein